MSFLKGLARVKVDGQKGLSKDKPIRVLEAPDVVYIPLCIGVSIQFDIHVKEGDHVDIGTKLATRKDMYVPLYSPVSGTVKGFEKRPHLSGRICNHIVIENDHQDTKVKAIDVDVDNLTSEEVVGVMKEMGLVGLGGSGFPTFIKYGHPEQIHTILINGVECEPFLTSDHVSMKRDIDELFKGTALMMKAAQCDKAVIAIKVHRTDLFEMMKAKEAEYPGITGVEVPDAYPMGWEKTLVKQVFKKEYDKLPSEVGVIVNNASTAIALSKACYQGDAIYRRVMTVSGTSVNEPQNVDVVVGTPFNEILAQIGGLKDGDGYILGGGPMMGKPMNSDQFVIHEYCNGITCNLVEKMDTVACLKCGECTLHCPAHLQPVKAIQAVKANNLEAMEKLEISRCVECGICTYVCPSKIEVTDFVKQAKQAVYVANLKKQAQARAQANKGGQK